MKALTINDFRNVIGVNNYGEVRLNNEGGLEKINTHFLQRWGIGRTNPDRSENILIRQMFADAIKNSGLPDDAIPRILDKLGVRSDLSAMSELAGKPLTRADIKSIIADLDSAQLLDAAENKAKWKSSAVLDLGKAFFKEGATWLKGRISAYNAANSAADAKINLNSSEVKILCSRHRAEIMGLMREASNENDFMAKLKTFIADKNIREGVSKFNGTASATRGKLFEPLTRGGLTLNSKFLHSKLFLKAGHRSNLFSTQAQFRHLKLTAGDFDTFKIYRPEEDDVAFEKATKNAEFTAQCGTLLQGLSKAEISCIYGAWSNAQNFQRNQIKLEFGTNKVDLVELRGKSVAEFRKAIVEFLTKVRRENKDMTTGQFVALTKMFNQSYYNTAMSFGLPGYSSPASDGTIKVDYNPRNNQMFFTYTGKKDSGAARGNLDGKIAANENLDAVVNDLPAKFKSVLAVGRDGTAQYQFAGEDTSV